MSLSINQNIMAMNSYRNLSATQNGLSKSLEKLSSGFRINRAADDAAGLAISEGLRSQVQGNKQAVRNAQDGISVVQTAEGALHEVHGILQRMRVLAVQGANDSNDKNARGAIKAELTQLQKELGRIGEVTNFNGTNLLDGNANLNFQVGANGDANNAIGVDLREVSMSKLSTLVEVKADETAPKSVTNVDKLSAVDGDKGGVNVSTHANAQLSIASIDKGIELVSTARANLGAIQNRFEHTITNLNVAVENLSASESRIRDTDMAQEMMQFTRNQILSQAGTAMLAQANQVPQGVLSLLR